jgi:Zn-dependent M28 family amino/carboxypeptidase
MSLRRLPHALLLCLLVVVVTPLSAEEARRAAKTEESEARLKRDIYFLASDECEGRGPTTGGLKKAGDYIAAEFKKAGLKPGNPDGTYFQNFTTKGAVLEAPATLVLKRPDKKAIDLQQGSHFHPMGLGGAGKLADAPVVFAGYGMTTKPRAANDPTVFYDEYAGLDVAGKVVIVLRDVPRTGDTKQVSPFGTFRLNGSLTRKLINADEHGAAAVIFVNDPDTARDGDDLLDFNFTAVGSAPERSAPDPDKPGKLKPVPVNLPAFHMKRELLQQMLKAAGADLGKIEAAIDEELKPQSLPLMGWTGGAIARFIPLKPQSTELKGWTVSLEVKSKRDKLPLRNVIGVLEGMGPLANETVVVGAHYDHLGYGGAGGSLGRLKKMAIHHGADDNGSGSTAVMELARRLAAIPDREGRRVVFMTFSGEELGLLGSAHYAKEPLYPLKDTVFMLNLDMVGRLRPDKDPKRDRLLAEGIGTGKDFEKLVDEWNKTRDFDLKKTAAAIPYSDHFSFYNAKVPVLFFWTNYHDDYHRPTDTADKINVPGMRRIVDLSEEILTYFAALKERPVWQEVKGRGPIRPGRGGPTLGFRPEFGTEDGVGVGEVREGGVGAKAGLKAGDKIVEVAGKPVKNLEGYTELMATLKAGDTIDVVVLRDGKKVTLKVKLE